MSSDVLQPRDCLVDRNRVQPQSFYYRRKGGNTNSKCVSARKPGAPSDKKADYGKHEKVNTNKKVELVNTNKKKVDNGKPETAITKKSPVCDLVKKNRSNKVIILKRGESLELRGNGSKKSNSVVHPIVSATERMGPKPDMFSRHIKGRDMRSVSAPIPISSPAGSAFSVSSPSPNLCKSVGIYAGSAFSLSSPSSNLCNNSVDIYAGTGFSMSSPSPNSLPLPSFFGKKQVSKLSQDSATRDLCRLLRLE